jgi:hypothetical protein
MTMLIEQHQGQPSQVAAAARNSRRLVWTQVDIFAGTDVSAPRRLAAWIALSITLAACILLLLGT